MGAIMASELSDSDIPLDQAMFFHLRHNHYPPIPGAMVEPCLDAIDACNEGDYERLIQLPVSVEWQGQSKVPAHVLAEYAHLDEWIAEE